VPLTIMGTQNRATGSPVPYLGEQLMVDVIFGVFFAILALAFWQHLHLGKLKAWAHRLLSK
jgi:hypothetical protein